MREVALGRRARDIQFRHRRSNAFEQGAGLSDDRFVPVRLRAEGRRRFVGLLHVALEPIERQDVFVELPLSCHESRLQIFDAAARIVALGRQSDRSRFELHTIALRPFGGPSVKSRLQQLGVPVTELDQKRAANVERFVHHGVHLGIVG